MKRFGTLPRGPLPHAVELDLAYLLRQGVAAETIHCLFGVSPGRLSHLGPRRGEKKDWADSANVRYNNDTCSRISQVDIQKYILDHPDRGDEFCDIILRGLGLSPQGVIAAIDSWIRSGNNGDAVAATEACQATPAAAPAQQDRPGCLTVAPAADAQLGPQPVCTEAAHALGWPEHCAEVQDLLSLCRTPPPPPPLFDHAADALALSIFGVDMPAACAWSVDAEYAAQPGGSHHVTLK
ncbi:MAG: hypothetical protein EOO40_05655 [Deltaproteobacteria bacterium]|nr:MAG: hypothetical protein EOO40_05655 [Deltaproteobacteria bacterium]